MHRDIRRAYLLESGCETLGIAREERARSISKKFAATRNGELDKLRGDGGENNTDNRKNHKNCTPLSIIATSTTAIKRHAQENIRDDSNKTREHHRNRHKEHVAILDMREFVRNDALELWSREY